MKIALLAPAGAMHRWNGNFKRSLHYAPLTLTTLAALVPPDLGAEVVIHDETAGVIPKNLDADLVGITCITGTSTRCYAWADWYRARGATVVLGGVHPTMMPDEAARHADAVVTGYAEQTWPRLLRDFKAGRLQKLYRQNEDFSISPRPAPRRELLNPKRYITMNTAEVVRGCPLPCTFCAYPAAFGRTVYTRPVREVIAEIEAMPGKEVLFPDINLIADHAYAKEFFFELIPLKKWWFGLSTSDITMDKELFSIIVKSGCKGLLIGFESVTQDSQAFVRKGINKVGSYVDLMKALHGAGIAVNGCFAFGGDSEDESVFERTVDAVVETKMDLPRFSILTPFPATQLYRDFEAQGRIIERNWAMYDVEHCVFKPLKMAKQRLEAGIEWAWRETYKLKNIAHRLSTPKTLHIATIPANLGGYRVYADRFAEFTREKMCDNSDIDPRFAADQAPEEWRRLGTRVEG